MDIRPVDDLKFNHLMFNHLMFGWSAALPSILPSAKNYSSSWRCPLPEGERERRKKRRKLANASRKRNRQ